MLTKQVLPLSGCQPGGIKDLLPEGHEMRAAGDAIGAIRGIVVAKSPGKKPAAKPKSTLDYASLIVTFLIIVAGMQLVAMICKWFGLHQDVSKYVMGVGFAGFKPVHDLVQPTLGRMAKRAAGPRSDGGYRAGILMGVAVFVVYQVASLYAALVLGLTLRRLGLPTLDANAAEAAGLGIGLFALPAAGIAAAWLGFRISRSGDAPLRQLALAGLLFTAAWAATNGLASPRNVLDGLADMTAWRVIGYLLALAMIAAAVAAAGGIGMIVARLIPRGDGTAGR